MGYWLKRLLTVVLGAISLILATLCFNWGFTTLSESRQMERLPMTPVNALAGGPYAVSGTIQRDGNVLTAPYSKQPALYVRYLLEEEYHDSDGDLRTRTLDSGQRSTRFRLSDNSGTLAVNPTLSTSSIDWAVSRTYRKRQGDLIYSEWTLSEGQTVELLGRVQPGSRTFVFNNLDVNLPPIVTDSSLQAAGGRSLLRAALIISLAAGLVSLGVALLLIGLGVHRFILYVSAMTLIMTAYFWGQGVYQLERDWQRAASLYQMRLTAIDPEPTLEQRTDLLAMQLLITRGAQPWPDRLFFERLAGDYFPTPEGIDPQARQIAVNQIALQPSNRFDNTWVAILGGSGGALLSILLLWLGVRRIKLKRMIEHLPTTATTGLSYGLSELKGTIDLNTEPLTSKLTGNPCIAFHYLEQEKRGSGKKSRWVTLEEIDQRIPFELKDETGNTWIYPEKATLHYAEKTTNRQGRRRFTESWIPPDDELYCLGFAGLDIARPDRLALQHEEDQPFILSTLDEQKLIQRKGAQGFLLTSVSLGFLLGAMLVLLAYTGSLTPADLLLAALLTPVFLFLYTMILHYNDIIFLRNRCDKAKADIQTVLQRRFDLIPRLNQVLQGYLQHEQALQTALTEARTASPRLDDHPEQIDRHSSQLRTLGKLISARVEAYPELKGNSLITEFMEQLEATENYLSLLRNGYNDAVELYNTRIQSFPDVILAKVFGFKGKGLFET
ncbi:LemA family protein [Saccharospirillum impatiens]|uniref:LemA family protein n=1 Tax=Saccharospirillum impatiens TaxID=169438 RepID=UPI00041EBFEF|nr:LemA family protein [Saccharospirillum impatiens]